MGDTCHSKGDTGLLSLVNDPSGRLRRFVERLAVAAKGRGRFVLCLGSTRTSDIEGVSAAGATPAARRLTPAIDAEALVLGRTVSQEKLPVSPAGIVSPVVITRAALGLCGVGALVVDCGSFQPPAVEHTTMGVSVSQCLSTGQALSLENVGSLFESGLKIGRQLCQEHDFLVVGECVPGGTTTALGVLSALGVEARDFLSSSLPAANHDLRARLVRQGLDSCRLSTEEFKAQPLSAVAAVGDPMQPVAAGIALSVSSRIPVLLAGGSQMMAVYALVRALSDSMAQPVPWENIAVMTTKWVAFDPCARSAELSRLVEVPFAASCPDFHLSRHEGLRAYEQGNVKEGVGAGGAMALCSLSGFAAGEIMEAIDRTYDEMVLSSG